MTSVGLLAQQESPIGPGARVRVSRLGTVPPVICTVLALKADTLVLDAEDRVETLEVPLSLVKKVEVSRGQKSNAGSGALKVGLIGASIGAVLGSAAWLGSDSDDFIEIGPEAVAVGAAVLGGVGAFAGLLIGAATVSDRWEDVPLNEIYVGPSSIAVDAVDVSVTLRL
jgi:hypothetical protein